MVPFLIFFYDFVTPQKYSMSEGCWLFTLTRLISIVSKPIKVLFVVVVIVVVVVKKN